MTEVVKVGIDCEEWWPVYTIEDENEFSEKTLEIPLSLYIRFKHIMLEFSSLQEEIQKYYEKGE
jgi:hypothetical protein